MSEIIEIEENEKANKPTPEQEKAISAKINSPTVVSAAAGTGKTTMLVERVLRLISDCENPIPADSLAIMTFTVNATKHLREKLNSALVKRIEMLEDGAERDFLAEQTIRLRNASISTINSFCLGIIKDNIEKFDLPVNVAVADETKIASLQWTAINLARQDFYNDEYFEPEERKLLFYSFDFETDKTLFENVISTADALSSYSDSSEWLDTSVKNYESIENLERFYIPVFVDFVKTQHAKALHYKNQLDESYGEYCFYYDNLPEGRTKKDKTDKEKRLKVKVSMEAFLDCLNRLIDFAENFLANPTLDTLEKLTQFAEIGAPAIDGSDTKNPIKIAFNEAKKPVISVFDTLANISVSKSEEEQNLLHNRTVITAFVKLIKKYREYFTEVKRAQGFVDFSDCELLLLDKLRNDEDFREQLSSRFSCVIVDEFQDCNDVQAEIFKLIGKEYQFYVGDIKQSIYAFRGGNPEIMAGLCKPQSGFEALPLTNNFRSRQPVIDTVNDAFMGLMTEKYGGVDYNDKTKLVCGAKFPDAEDNSKYNTEIFALDYREYDNQIQARFVAQKIDELMRDEDFKITKNGRLCRPELSDFAILLRTNTGIENYRRALAERGISSVAPRGKNMLESEEVALLINFLKVIDNPLNDNELLHVLMSPLYRLSAEKIARIKLGILGFPEELSDETRDISACMKHYALCECLKFCTSSYNERGDYAKTKAKQKAEAAEKELAEKGIFREIDAQAFAAQQDIVNFRRFMRNNSIVDLIRKVCADTDIYAVVCALDDSRKRVANLHRFEKIAEEFVSRDGGTLCDFLRFIKRIEENKSGKIEEASVPEDAANSVKIMTFHASKGLEVPICILAELQWHPKAADYSGKFLINHNYLFSINFVDRKARYKASSFAHHALELANRQKPIGEELRLLYVAMTRAQEKLIMVGKFSGEEKIPSFAPDIYEGVIPFKWVLRSLLRTGKYKMNIISEFSEKQSIEGNKDAVPEISEEDLKSFEHFAEQSYRNQAETTQRMKYSVTELAHKNDVMPFVLTKPKFAKKSRIKGSDIGNAYHHTMQHISLEKIQNSADLSKAVQQEIQELTVCGKITEDERKLLKSEKISEFFLGELGQRMLQSSKIERECSFYAELSGEEINLPEIGENVEIQGQIDMFFEEDDGIVIVDYKTDSEENLQKEKENYTLQVKIYAAVAPKLFGKPVKELYLYSFSSGKAVKI